MPFPEVLWTRSWAMERLATCTRKMGRRARTGSSGASAALHLYAVVMEPFVRF